MNKHTIIYKHTYPRLFYIILGIYSVIINWHYNQDILDAILAWIFCPIYLIYSLVTGHLAHHLWYDIPAALFN